MSHTEAFGHLRSFVVGLEIKARDLRTVLESSRDNDGKWINGKDGTGIGERCARAIGAASPEQVTKDMIAEVAEQDKLIRQVEESMRTEHPIQEATEKYQALMEYNQLALEDLEERLSAYGYVRPARVSLGEKKAADPPAASSVARLPARTKQDGGSGGNGNGGGGGAGSDGAQPDPPAGCREGREAIAPGGRSTCQEGEQKGEGEGGREDRTCSLEAGSGWEAAAEAGACAGSGTATAGGERGVVGEEDETAAADQEEDGGGACSGGVTPARPALVLSGEPDEEPGSPPTPASPGLADWEITEGTREMLRRAQPQQQQQQQQQTGEASSATAPRSLEALLAENTAAAAAGAGPAAAASGGGGGRRSSVSSDWSPPPSSTNATLSPFSSSGRNGGRQRRGLNGDGRRGGGVVEVGSSMEGLGASGTPQAEAAGTAVIGAGGVSMSAWGSSSNPPTPARMGFEDDGAWTPGGQAPAVAGAAGDRESSLGSPDLSFRSPLQSDVTAHLVETVMSCGRQPDACTTPGDKEDSGPVTSPPEPTPEPTPIRRRSLQGDEASIQGSLPKKAPRGDFWGNVPPASPVVESLQEATGEQPAPMSPETPATPKMLSPRFGIESSGGSADAGGGAASAAGSSGCVTRSSSRNMALTPNVAGGGGGGGIVDDNSNTSGRGGSGSGHDEGSDGYDSESCPTPELSSPLRSTNISSRDLQVLTPSAARTDSGGNAGNGSYRRGSGDGDSGGGGGYDEDSYTCPTPELSSPLRAAGSAALCRRRLEEAGGAGDDEAAAGGVPLELVSEEEYAKAPKFLTIQVSRSVLNDTIENLNAYAAPRLGSPSELLLTVDEIMAIIDQGELSRTLLLSAAHLKRIEMKGPRMYRIRA